MPHSSPSRTLSLRGLVACCLEPNPPPPPAQRLDGYELLEKIGSGGMGTVWRARQLHLNREVALKILHEDLARDPAFTTAFQRESEITATLRHPGIVPIYESGHYGDVWYHSMEWVDADNLEDLLREYGSRPLKDSIRIVRDAALAVAHAHAQGILHRDLKPSNLLVDAAGQVKVLDFGLARHSGQIASGRTAPLLGTPHYAAPEQAAGQTVTPAADVYALGTILYRLLCGRVPFSGESPTEVIEQARREPPIPPRRLNPSIPFDIEVIILKALEKNPTLRYAHAEAFAADLTAWLEGKPIQARPVGWLGTLRRWIQREPFQAALAAVLLLSSIGMTWQLNAASRARKLARHDRELAALQLIAATLREGHRANASRNFHQTFDAATIDRWGFPARWLRAECSAADSGIDIQAHQDKIWNLALSPDQQTLFSTSEDGDLAAWNPQTGQSLFRVPFPETAPFGIAFLKDPDHLLITSIKGQSFLFNPSSRTWTSTQLQASFVTTSPDRKWRSQLIGNPHFWEPEGRIEICPNQANSQTLYNLPGKRAAFSPDGTHVAIGRAAPRLQQQPVSTPQTLIEIYDLHLGKLQASLLTLGPHESVRSLIWSDDGSHLFAAEGNSIHCWEIHHPSPIWTSVQQAGIWQLQLFEQHLLAACSDQVCRSLDPATGETQQTLRGHTNEVWSITPLPHSLIASGDKSGHLRITSLQNSIEDLPIQAETRGVFSTHQQLITLHQGKLHLLSPEGALTHLEAPELRSLHGWDPRRQNLLAIDDQNALCWFDLTSSRITFRIPRPGTIPDLSPSAVAISQDGSMLFDSTNLGLQLRDAQSGHILQRFPAIPSPLVASAFSPDGRFLFASSSKETRIGHLYHLPSGKSHTLTVASDEILACAFSPDNRYLALGGGDSRIYIWQLSETPKLLQCLEGHLESVLGLAFTPDGQWLTSAGSGESIRFWLTHTWETGPAAPSPPGGSHLLYRPDGKMLTIVSRRGNSAFLHLIPAP